MPTLVLFPLAPPPHEHCSVCHAGCACTPEDASCGHYGCHGRGPLTCPSGHAARAAYEVRLRSIRAQRARLAARRAALVGRAYRPPTLLP
jgi:hypothetical protein